MAAPLPSQVPRSAAPGQIVNASGATLYAANDTFNCALENAGTLVVMPGTVTITGALTSDSGSTINVQEGDVNEVAYLDVVQNFTNHGVITPYWQRRILDLFGLAASRRRAGKCCRRDDPIE